MPTTLEPATNSQTELTTQQTADLLGVSRPPLIKLMENAHIAFRQAENRRYVSVAALIRYRDENQAARLRTLHALQDEAQMLDMGY